MSDALIVEGIDLAQAAVDKFNVDITKSEHQPLVGLPQDGYVISVGRALLKVSERMLAHYQNTGQVNKRALRAHLEIEELGEYLIAMGEADELLTLDAQADRLYVLLGSCATMQLPLAAAFVEVHRSNMTKERQPDDPAADRVRSKGPNYSPPDLNAVFVKTMGRLPNERPEAEQRPGVPADGVHEVPVLERIVEEPPARAVRGRVVKKGK